MQMYSRVLVAAGVRAICDGRQVCMHAVQLYG